MNDTNEQKPSIHIGGNVRGQNVVIGSTQTIHGDLTITVGSLPAASEDVRQVLQEQIGQLIEALKTVPVAESTKVQEVRMAAEDAVREAENEKPKRQWLEIRGENLKKAAESLAAIAPIVLKIASQVAATLAGIGEG